MKLQKTFCLLIVLFGQLSVVLSEPISIAIGVAIASSSGTVAYYLRCKFQECCNDDYIPYDINGEYIFKYCVTT